VQLDAARNRGAQLNFDKQMITFHASSAAVEVTSSKATYRADRLVITAGPWMAELLPEQQHLFPVYRQVLYWFDIADQAHYELYRDMPVFIWEFGNRAVDSMYGFPAVDGATGGLKIATEYFGESTTPLAADRMVSESETRETYEHYVRDRFPGLTPRAVKTATCLYTTTPDARFVIDRHPAARQRSGGVALFGTWVQALRCHRQGAGTAGDHRPVAAGRQSVRLRPVRCAVAHTGRPLDTGRNWTFSVLVVARGGIHPTTWPRHG